MILIHQDSFPGVSLYDTNPNNARFFVVKNPSKLPKYDPAKMGLLHNLGRPHSQ